MKAAVYRSFGGPEVLEVVEVPEPKMFADQVRIRIKAAALNPADLGFQAGAVDALVDSFFPVIPGWDVAGIVEEAGTGTTGFKPGDEVIGFVRGAIQRHGSYAEQIAAEPRQLARKPANLEWTQAAGLPLAGLTAYQAVARALHVRAGETVLVHGAAGGVGHLAVQIAAARGASVIGTASASNHDYLRSLGVKPAAYGDGLADRVRALAPGGVDAVLDTAGRGALAITQRIGTAGVRAASVANSNEHPGTIQVFARLDQADLEALVELAEAGKLSVRVARSFPLDQAADAQRLLAAGHSGGKIVLTVAEPSPLKELPPMPDSLSVSAQTRINAPLEKAWQVLTDFGNYHAWHPVLTLEPHAGPLAVGTQLQGQSSGGPAGEQPVAFTIAVVQEPSRLAWTGGDPEVLEGRHSFRLEQLADGTTRFTESEVFTGPAAPEVIGGQLPELHAAYETFAAAFKKRVEEGISGSVTPGSAGAKG